MENWENLDLYGKRQYIGGNILKMNEEIKNLRKEVKDIKKNQKEILEWKKDYNQCKNITG